MKLSGNFNGCLIKLWLIYLPRWATYSSFPRKDVSLHATARALDKTMSEEDFFGRGSSKALKPLRAVTGVTIWSELTEVMSVLMSKDVQEESEDKEGLVSTVSSLSAFRSMALGWKWKALDGEKQKKREWRGKLEDFDNDLREDACIMWCLDKAKVWNGWKEKTRWRALLN